MAVATGIENAIFTFNHSYELALDKIKLLHENSCPRVTGKRIYIWTMNGFVKTNAQSVRLNALRSLFDPDIDLMHKQLPHIFNCDRVALQDKNTFQNCVIIKLFNDDRKKAFIAIKVFNTASMQISGCKKIVDALGYGIGVCKLFEIIDKKFHRSNAGYDVTDVMVHLVNASLKLDLDENTHRIKPNAVVDVLKKFCPIMQMDPVLLKMNISLSYKYDPDNHAGVRIYLQQHGHSRKITVMLFRKLNILISGWTSGNELYPAYLVLMRLLNDHFDDVIYYDKPDVIAAQEQNDPTLAKEDMYLDDQLFAVDKDIMLDIDVGDAFCQFADNITNV